MRSILTAAVLLAANFAYGVTYVYTADVTKSIDESTSVKAQAFGIPLVTSIVTEATLDVTASSETPGLFTVTISSFKQTTYGTDRESGGYRNEENLEGVLNGKTLVLNLSEPTGNRFTSDATIQMDSEYFDYNLLALMLTPPTQTGFWNPPVTLAIPRNCPKGLSITETVTYESDENVVIAIALNQDNKTVQMTGAASYNGKLSYVLGSDGLPDTAEFTMEGVQNRLITIFGGDNELVDNVKGKITLVRSPEDSE